MEVKPEVPLTKDLQYRPTPGESLHAAQKVECAITIRHRPEQIYQFWRKFENLSYFMRHVQSVIELDLTHSRWIVQSVGDRLLTWDAEIIEDRPHQMISWRTIGDADVPQAGSVWFKRAPDDQGTEVRVLIKYDPPLGRIGEWTAMLFGQDARSAIREDLHRLKAYLEAGEIPTIEGQSSGREPAHEVNKQYFLRTWSSTHDQDSSEPHH